MKNEQDILEALASAYREIGGDPSELVRIQPSHGGWLNALKYKAVRADGATTWLSRADLDNASSRGLMKALKAFTPPGEQPRAEQQTPLSAERSWRGRSGDASLDKATRPPAQSRETVESLADSRLLLLCGSCSVERPHTVRMAEQSINSVVVVARCNACTAAIQLGLTGSSKPGRTIADRMRRALRRSVGHGATATTKCQTAAGLESTRNTRRTPEG